MVYLWHWVPRLSTMRNLGPGLCAWPVAVKAFRGPWETGVPSFFFLIP